MKKKYIAPEFDSVSLNIHSIMIGSVQSGGTLSDPESGNDNDDDVEGGRSRGFDGSLWD